MEIDYIKEFVVLAEKGNFLEAADCLFISQSSLSKHIKAIEKELAAPLFNRTTRKVALSEFGQLFLPYAKQIVSIQNEYAAAFFNKLENTRKTLTIGSIPSMAQYNITDVLARFKKSYPTCTLNVIQSGSTKLENMLRQSKYELAFVRQVNDIADEFVKIPYTVDILAAIFPAKHPLAKCKTVSLEQLKEEDFLLLPERTRPYNLCHNACEQHGFQPRVAFTDHNLGNLIDLVVREMGVALLMKKLAIYFSNPNIAIVDIAPNISTQISLCYKKNAELSDAAKHFLTCVRPV
ncbi:transcription regulator hth lysr [Lucifera butyrica]|uniref:Transcription regulator hth lysr n=1 Tax=Lucifera butyrica TaxID=1351585 RepID=A0A498RDB2_9FIRM|nr:LysR family transcriptional regulator [Lucifera butyrica]VBB09544.1 transcription regulator hth lysr [Lucifera butyrica]